MARNQNARYGAPPEEKEVVLTFDSRFLYGLILVGAFFVALGGGLVAARLRPGAPTQSGAPAPSNAGAPAQVAAPGEVDEATARKQAQALGLPTDVAIVNNTIRTVEEDPGKLGQPIPAGQVTPVSQDQADIMKDFGAGAVGVNIPPTRTVADADLWPHDVLANFEDPNVTDAKFAPLRTEDVKSTLAGPRIALSNLNRLNTYDFGYVSMTEPTDHDFEVKNMGDADLQISRVYSGCGCTATRLGDAVLDGAGWVVTQDGKSRKPYLLKPGEAAKFNVQFDPRNENREGSKGKFIQIFSNDGTRSIYDEADPLSHEVRFRIVVQPTFDKAKVEASAASRTKGELPE